MEEEHSIQIWLLLLEAIKHSLLCSKALVNFDSSIKD